MDDHSASPRAEPREASSAAFGPSNVALACEDVCVSFGDVRALADVSVGFAPGRIHALVGQNGAGKTTLARVFGGLIKPDAGRLWASGERLDPGDVTLTRQRGLDMVHQSFTLPPSFTVAEALELFSKNVHEFPVYTRRELNRKWQRKLAEAGISLAPTDRIRDLPVESLQAIEITRALLGRARTLILDEPTAVLAPQAAEGLFERLASLRDQGVTIILVLHKLREVDAIAETVTVLRDGRVVLPTVEIGETTHAMLSDLIVGEVSARATLAMPPPVEVERSEREDWVLRLQRVVIHTSRTTTGLSSTTLNIASGEIVGLAGVEGNGQRPLVDVITGLESPDEGKIFLGEYDVTAASPAARRSLGLRAVPFDRNTEGVSLSSTLWENTSSLGVVTGALTGRFSLISPRQLRKHARAALEHWTVRYGSLEQLAGELSGGNMQRLILSRELSPGVTVLIAAQPTRGLDIAATGFVRSTLKELRSAGVGVLLISSDLDELFELSQRIAVISSGAIVAEFTPPYDIQSVGDAMIGATRA